MNSAATPRRAEGGGNSWSRVNQGQDIALRKLRFGLFNGLLELLQITTPMRFQRGYSQGALVMGAAERQAADQEAKYGEGQPVSPTPANRLHSESRLVSQDMDRALPALFVVNRHGGTIAQTLPDVKGMGRASVRNKRKKLLHAQEDCCIIPDKSASERRDEVPSGVYRRLGKE